jgi:hypothetical protein
MLSFIVRKMTSRTVKLILFLLLVVPSLTWFALRTALILKGRQTETLLSQVKALRVRESSFQDAQQLADQYPGKVDYQGEPCTFEKCIYAIVLGPSWDKQPDSIESALRFVGIRTYRVDSSVQVRNGRIMEVAFVVDTEAKLDAAGGQWIAASAKVSDHFSRSDYYDGRDRGLDEHPNRQVRHPHFTTRGGGQIILSEVTADANARDIARAFDIRLSCISSLQGCSDLRDLAPSAWEDLMTATEEQRKRAEPPRGYGVCSGQSLARIARDMDNVLLVQVRKVFPPESGGNSRFQDVELGLIEILKGRTNNHLARLPLEIPEVDANGNARNSRLQGRMFSPGSQVVLFLKDSEIDFAAHPPCEVVPASDENLAVIRQTLTQLAHGTSITALAEDSHRVP